MKIILIAGGSGVGKSTLARNICKHISGKGAVLLLDDYFKKSEDVPKMHDLINWDHPDALRFSDIYRDATQLKNGRTITGHTKSRALNPRYNEIDEILGTKIKQLTILQYPRDVLIIEGFLALYDEALRSLADYTIFLDLPYEIRVQRRIQMTQVENHYTEKILKPMHHKYVEPTKSYANLCYDIGEQTPEQVFKGILPSIQPLLS